MRTAYKILIGLWFIPLTLFVLFIILINTKTIGGLIFSAVFLIWAYNSAIIMLIITALTLLYYLIKGKLATRQQFVLYMCLFS